ncbi:MAG: biopolymer transport protein ExbB [Bermanella sp.]|jgi:biopolymer transport protein ExbB
MLLKNTPFNKIKIKYQSIFFVISLVFASSLAIAEEKNISTKKSISAFIQTDDIIDLDELLLRTKNLKEKELMINANREDNFMANRDQQKFLVNKVKLEFLAEQKSANPLVNVTDQQQKSINLLQQKLNKHSEELGDIHSIYKQFSGDFTARMKDSIVHAQLTKREDKLLALQSGDALASIEDMREMWLLLMEEMTEAGKSVQFKASIINSEGKSKQQDVLRLGTFSLFSEGMFLRYISQNQELLAIDQQPVEQSSMVDFVDAVQQHAMGNSQSLSGAIIDPSRGDLLAILGQAPSLYERLLQGKEVGMVILILGLIGIILIIYRFIYLSITWVNTQRQLKSLSDIKTNNPLGRIFLKVKQLDVSSKKDDESLQLALDEAILKELPKLEQGHSLIKLFSAIAPLLGLLGTVIGMIATFQSISLFGSGDAKLMAGGISQALVTTVLGLTVAIPLLLSHNVLVSFSRVLMQILDEQSAGILAKDRESNKAILNDVDAS